MAELANRSEASGESSPDPATESDEGSHPADETAAAWTEVERRRTVDRRDRPTRFFGLPWARGKRRRGRRRGETENIYVDRYSRTDVVLLLLIFVLNIGDALFTLMWLSRGGGEGNPIMQFMLNIGDGAFIAQKCFVVGLWLIVLMVHRNFKAARIGMWSVLSVYSVLILYHFILVASGASPVTHLPDDLPPVHIQSSSEASQKDGKRGFDAQDSLTQSDGTQASAN